jgi:hypothetical protein
VGLFVQYSNDKRLLPVFAALLLFSVIDYKKIKSGFNIGLSFENIKRESCLSGIFVSNENIYFLLSWLCLPVILPFTISLFSQPIFIHRYTIPASLAFYLLAAKGLSNINNKYVKLFFIIVIVFISLGVIGRYYKKGKNPNWKEAVSYIEANAKPGDIVMVGPQVIFDYYSRRADLIKKYLHIENKQKFEENFTEEVKKL